VLAAGGVPSTASPKRATHPPRRTVVGPERTTDSGRDGLPAVGAGTSQVTKMLTGGRSATSATEDQCGLGLLSSMAGKQSARRCGTESLA